MILTEGPLGRMARLANFPSHHVPSRNVDIWLPPEYDADPERRYPVLYMQDGQSCFLAEYCPYHVPWDIQSAMARAASGAEMEPAIIVGIWNIGPLRYLEYRPARPFLNLSEHARRRVLAGLGGWPHSDAYLAFITEELKPYIDTNYRTRPDRGHTAIMGSSMGGLISLYAICEYPDVFGAAGCVSTHWPAVEAVILPYLREYLPDPATHRIYFDFGTHTIDALYRPTQQLVDMVMPTRGYERGVNWLTLEFPGTRHFETDWGARAHIPIGFMLSNRA